jgi:hypothetical protein
VRSLINVSLADYNPTPTGAPLKLTTDDLLAVCGAMDRQVLIAAIGGLVIALAMLFYLGRFRERLTAKQRLFFDKLLTVFMAMAYVIIITRTMRGG